MTNDAATGLVRSGEALRLRGRLDAAGHALEQALQLDPASAEARYSLAQVRRAQSRHDEAASHLRQLTAMHADLPQPWHLLATICREAGRTAEAAVCLERYADLVPGDAIVQTQCAELFLDLGETRHAMRLLDRARTADPTYSGASFLSGRVLFEDGDTEEAIEAYTEAVRLGSDLATPAGGRMVEAFVTPFPEWARFGSGDCRVLAPAEALDLPIPAVLPAEESRLWPAESACAPRIFTGRLDGAEVLGREFSVLAADGCFFTDGLVTSPAVYLRKRGTVKYASADGRVLLDLPRAPMVIDRPCMVLGRSNNYFHFLIESLPRLWAAEQYPVDATVHALVPDDLYPTQLELLALLDFPESRLIGVPTDGSVRCGTLYVPSLLSAGYAVSPRAVAFLRERILGRVGAVADLPRRVYLSRNRMPRRHVANEAELIPVLERHGFRTVYPEALDVAGQVGLFAQAEAILSPDSSALANLAFAGAQVNAGVLSWRGLHKPLWHCIARHAGARVTYIHADPVLESSPELAHRDMHVDPALVEAWIEGL